MRRLQFLWREFRESANNQLDAWGRGDFETNAFRHMALALTGQQRIKEFKRTSRKKVFHVDSAAYDLSQWKVITDSEVGGTSTASVRVSSQPCLWDPAKTVHTLVFEGELKPLGRPKQEKLPWFAPNKEKLKRLEEAKQANGYCGLVTPPFSRLNLEDFNSLHMNIKTDGRAYFFNVLPDGFILSQDIWQATIGEEKPRPLHEKSIEIDKLTQTCRGWTKMYQVPLPRERLKGFSWTVQGRQGRFRMELEWLEARVLGWKEMERLRSKVEQRKQKLKAERARVEAAAAAGGGGAGGAGVGGGQNAESKDISLDTPPNRSGVVLPFHVRAVVTKCKVQLMLMDASFEFLTKFFPSATATAAQGPSNSSSSSPLSTKHVFMVLHALTQSIEFARVFNHDIELRQRLYQVGFMRNRQASPPELFFQEAHGLKLYLQILLRVYLFEEGKVASGQGDSASSTAVADRLITMSQFVLSEYVQKQKNKEHPDMLRCMDTVICTLLEGLLSLSEAQFQQHISIFYYPLAELIQYGSPTIRGLVKQLFESRVRALLHC